MIIAIDGYTGTGKGTTAKGVAQILGYTYLDTGAMYRTVTLYAIKHKLLDASDAQKVAMMQDIHITFQYIQGAQHTFLNDIDVEHEIRTTALALQMKPIVTCLPLREEMIKLMQAYGTSGSIVCDGRDAGTHIFPDAGLKVFMTCDVPTRVLRRSKQLQEQGLEVDIHKITKETKLRDQTDYLGPDAINKKAPDAKELDTSHLTIQQQIQQVVDRAKEAL